MNKAFCNSCGSLVPAQPRERDGKVILEKDCPQCGRNDTVISSDARRYMGKRALDSPFSYSGCSLDCLSCQHRKQPTFVFMDITNRCNQNCPICINNTPSMGFLFEPPLEYFDKILRHFSHYDPPPAVQLFGGEPTVRADMFEIIRMARSYGLPTRVVTNGLKLADRDYCRRLVESRATILIAYDGCNPETYRVLRGSERLLELKHRAFENLREFGAAKVAIMTCLAKGFNDREMPSLLGFLHGRRSFVRGVYFLPLAQTWDLSEFNLKPERMSTEDIELMLAECFAGEEIDFVPAGVLGSLPTLMKYLRVKRPPFMGAHPNCESLYLLVSDGERYVPVSRYLKGSLSELVRALFGVEERLARRVARAQRSVPGRLLGAVGLRENYLALSAWLSVARALQRQARLSHVLKGRGIGKAWHALCALAGLLVGRSTRKVLERHSRFHEVLQIIVLPFEDHSVLETERLERCPNAFVFWDPANDRVKSVPTCAWPEHKAAVLKAISNYYGTAAAARTTAAPA